MGTSTHNHLQDTALRYFLEVVQCGSVSQASERLHVAMSAVSRQIAGLESQLNTPLFERHARGMVPTAAGEILARHARRISMEAEQAVDAIHALHNLHSGAVRIATSDAFADELLPATCAEFQARYPGVQFEVMVSATPDVSRRVLMGDAELGLCFSLAPAAHLRVVHRQRAPVMAMFVPGHPLARKRRVTLADVARHPHALPPPQTTVRQMIDMACARQELRLEPVLVSNHVRMQLRHALDSGMVCIASEVGARQLLRAGSLVAKPLADEGMDLRDIEVHTLADRTLLPATQRFLELLVLRLLGEE